MVCNVNTLPHVVIDQLVHVLTALDPPERAGDPTMQEAAGVSPGFTELDDVQDRCGSGAVEAK